MRRTAYDNLRNFILNSDKHMCGVFGNIYVGKTALVEKLCREFKDSDANFHNLFTCYVNETSKGKCKYDI